jgi:hypothetical protein
MAQRLQLFRATQAAAGMTMENDCEVVGWVLVDDAAQVLMRKEGGDNSSPALSADKAFEHFAIQTGSFRRNRLIDSVTRRALVHEAD